MTAPRVERRLAAILAADAVTGGQIWSERYDRPLDGLLAVQDELAQRIVNSLGGLHGNTRRAAIESARSKPPRSLRAYDLMLLALEEKFKLMKEANAKALDPIQQAVAFDPRFGGA